MWVTDDNVALLTDLYELTMSASYFAEGMHDEATFELFVRHLPESRNFLVSAGLDDALHYLEHLHFDGDAVAYLRGLGIFRPDFLEYLATLRFTGDVWAIPEGAVFFAGEPMLRITAPLIEAQIVETFLLNCLNFQSLIASKAARVAIACDGRRFVDFSPRRDHGADAAMKAARASYIGGASATSNVLAARAYGIAPSGTMAHAYVMSFDRELDAFLAFARTFPERSTLLIDTYDSVEGARNAVRAADLLAPEGVKIQGVRLDSGDLPELARAVRDVLDEGGYSDIQIFASGDLDEYRIAALLQEDAPIDAFGIGTQLGVSADAPALGGIYKLVEDKSGPKMKRSTAKVTIPGRKQVYRCYQDAVATHDTLALHDESPPPGVPLLQKVMEGGRRTTPPESLSAARERCSRAVKSLPPALRSLHPAPDPFPVRCSARLESLLAELIQAPH